jgi:hypothetical protein
MAVICVAQAIVNFDNISTAIAWTVACAGWIPHVFINHFDKENIL